jgi:aspartate/methionine/tyrosine aminotransferase
MFSDRVKSIKPFIVMEILEKALEMEQNGIDVIHFEIGEPDFDTPNSIINGCFSEIKEGRTHYTHSLGYLELRDIISAYKLRTRGTYYDPKNQIMVTGGSSPAFFIILSTLINPGDEVIISDPGYPCYVNFINFFRGKPVFLPIHERNEFNLDIESLKDKISPKTKAIILNSPSNPTGQIIPKNTLSQISKLIAKKKLWVISDEIYSELTYNGQIAPSLSDREFSDCHENLIIVDGLSKAWAMTGFRIGYIAAPSEFIKAIISVQQNFLICAPSISQAAALHAFECQEEIYNMVRIYKERRDYIVKRLNKLNGISCLEPKGAFYVFANIKDLQEDSMDFSLKLLEKAHVATCPGISFGKNSEGFIRFSYPTDIIKIKEGMDRLENFVAENYY